MPILLEEDCGYPLSRMHKVRQLFETRHFDDVHGAVIRELAKQRSSANCIP